MRESGADDGQQSVRTYLLHGWEGPSDSPTEWRRSQPGPISIRAYRIENSYFALCKSSQFAQVPVDNSVDLVWVIHLGQMPGAGDDRQPATQHRR